jgi:hypothetical protein
LICSGYIVPSISLKSASGGFGKNTSLKSSAFCFRLIASRSVFGSFITGVSVGVCAWVSLARAHLATRQSFSGSSAACSIVSLCLFLSAFLIVLPFSFLASR